MNSRQRRRQRRMLAPLRSQIAEVEADKSYAMRLVTKFSREKAELLRRTWQLDEEARDARRVAAESKELADHEIRKLTENAKRLGPLVAEYRIALRHIVTAITGVPPQFRDDVADINQLRLRMLAVIEETR